MFRLAMYAARRIIKRYNPVSLQNNYKAEPIGIAIGSWVIRTVVFMAMQLCQVIVIIQCLNQRLTNCGTHT